MHSALLRRILPVAAAFLGLMTAARAQIQIDDFFFPTSLLQATAGNPVFQDTSLTIDGDASTRRLTATAAGTFALDTEIDGTSWIIDGGGPGAGSADAEVEYLGFSLNLGTNYYFEFAVNKVVGTPVLGVILQNTGAGLQLSDGAQLTPTTNGYSVFFDVRNMSGYNTNFLSGVDDIQVFVGAADQPLFVDAAFIQFSPVPEPSTWALLAAAGGLMVLGVRRRRV
jgi:hypothetical protein